MKEKAVPEIIKKRIEIAKMFYPLERNEERKWARVFHKGLDSLYARLETEASKLSFIQDLKENYIIWIDPDKNTNESMFCIISDATSFKSVQSLISKIEELRPIFTYAIVHQQKDGEGTYDIFRLSKFSYLEHCNRVKVPSQYKKKST
jgi:hypothetical protein